MMSNENKEDQFLKGQERYLKDAKFTWQPYKMPKPSWDHDHCDFCFVKFMEPGNSETLHEGYYAKDQDTWVCRECFERYRERFNWSVSE